MGKKKKDIEHYSIKCKLKNILKISDLLPIIKERVKITNQLWIESYFLFNLYMLNQLNKNKIPSFNYNTLERCALFVIDKQDKIRGTKDEQTNSNNNELQLLKDAYNDYLTIGNNYVKQYKKIPCIQQPITYLSREIMTNIKNHCSLNFYRFQRQYLKHKYLNIFTKQKIKKSIIYSILGCVQYHINTNCEKLVIRSKYIAKLDNLNIILRLMKKIINIEKK